MWVSTKKGPPGKKCQHCSTYVLWPALRSAPPSLSSGATDVMQSVPHQRGPGSCVKTNCDENPPLFLSEEGGQLGGNERANDFKREVKNKGGLNFNYTGKGGRDFQGRG